MKYDTNINKNQSQNRKYDTNINKNINVKSKYKKSYKKTRSGKGGCLFLIILAITLLFVSCGDFFSTPSYNNYDSNDYDYDDAVKYLQDSINSQR